MYWAPAPVTSSRTQSQKFSSCPTSRFPLAFKHVVISVILRKKQNLSFSLLENIPKDELYYLGLQLLALVFPYTHSHRAFIPTIQLKYSSQDREWSVPCFPSYLSGAFTVFDSLLPTFWYLFFSWCSEHCALDLLPLLSHWFLLRSFLENFPPFPNHFNGECPRSISPFSFVFPYSVSLFSLLFPFIPFPSLYTFSPLVILILSHDGFKYSRYIMILKIISLAHTLFLNCSFLCLITDHPHMVV